MLGPMAEAFNLPDDIVYMALPQSPRRRSKTSRITSTLSPVTVSARAQRDVTTKRSAVRRLSPPDVTASTDGLTTVKGPRHIQTCELHLKVAGAQPSRSSRCHPRTISIA